jgi:hypothetical protein
MCLVRHLTVSTRELQRLPVRTEVAFGPAIPLHLVPANRIIQRLTVLVFEFLGYAMKPTIRRAVVVNATVVVITENGASAVNALAE